MVIRQSFYLFQMEEGKGFLSMRQYEYPSFLRMIHNEFLLIFYLLLFLSFILPVDIMKALLLHMIFILDALTKQSYLNPDVSFYVYNISKLHLIQQLLLKVPKVYYYPFTRNLWIYFSFKFIYICV